MTRFIPIGTQIQVRNPMTGKTVTHVTTEKVVLPVRVTATEETVTFAHKGYVVTVSVNLVETDRTCQRCNGKGYLSAYRHVQNGVCFGCGGHGVRNSIGYG